jgi:hypothetical protein
MKEPIELHESLADLRCPCCAGTDMKVREIWGHFPADEILVALTTDPLRVIELQNGDSDQAWLTLTVYCAGCDREMDLYLRGRKIRVDRDADNARAIWGNLA